MSDRTTIRNFWMIFIASLALVLIVMAIVNASLQIGTMEENDQSGVRATIPATTPLNPATPPVPWYERAVTWMIGFVLTVILSGRFILLIGVLLFYGFIISYIAPNAWQKIKSRGRGRAGDAAEKVITPRKDR